MKKNKWTRLITMILGAGILGAAIWLAFAPESDQNPAPTGKFLTDYKIEDISGVDVQRNDGVFQFRKDQSHWFLENDPSFNLDQEAALAVFTNCAYLSITEELRETPADLAAFGLNPASCTLTIYMADETTEQVLIGAETMDKKGRFVMLTGKNKIAIIPDYAGKVFMASKNELFNRSVGMINWGSFHSLKIKKPGTEEMIVELNPDTPLDYAGDLSRMFLVKSPFQTYAKPVKIKTLFDDLSKMRFDTYEGVAADLKPYGLDIPRVYCLLDDAAGNLMEFSIGSSFKREDKTFYYCNRPTDPENIFSITEEKAAFGNTTPFSLVDTAVFPKAKNETIKKITITTGNPSESYVFLPAGEVNGKKISAASAEAINTHFNTITYMNEVTQEPKKDIAFTILAEFDARMAEVNFYAYSDDLYAVDQGFGQYLCVSRAAVDGLMDALVKAQ